MRSNSLFYGMPVSANAFPTYSTADLQRDLASPSIDAETSARINAEIARRTAIEIRRDYAGHFTVLVHGVERYEIVNGSAGVSGRGPNMYGIVSKETGKVTWVGTLQSAKKMVRHWASKNL